MTAPAALGPREAARRAGVSPDTLRHYEKKGLLPAPPRSAGGYRRYPPETVARVQLIRRALVIGFTLDDLARVFRERDRGGAPCRGVRDIVAGRLDALDAQLRELAVLRRQLRALLAEWDRTLARTTPGERAHLLLHLPAAVAAPTTTLRPTKLRARRRP
jgi:DNA-binding transcriptional MerR regulator